MTKKEYIKKLLEKISGKSDFAKGLYILVKCDDVDNKTIDFIFDFLSEKIADFLSEENKKMSYVIKKIREQEANEKNVDLEIEFGVLLDNL